MKVLEILPYQGPVDTDGLVTVHDITVTPHHAYSVCGVVVSNSKRVSLLDVNALLSHVAGPRPGNARANTVASFADRTGRAVAAAKARLASMLGGGVK